MKRKVNFKEGDLVTRKDDSRTFIVIETGKNYSTMEAIAQIAPIEDKDQMEWVKRSDITKAGAK